MRDRASGERKRLEKKKKVRRSPTGHRVLFSTGKKKKRLARRGPRQTGGGWSPSVEFSGKGVEQHHNVTPHWGRLKMVRKGMRNYDDPQKKKRERCRRKGGVKEGGRKGRKMEKKNDMQAKKKVGNVGRGKKEFAYPQIGLLRQVL